MKKILYLFALTCLALISCDPYEYITTRYRLHWDVKNTTSQELYFYLEDRERGYEIRPNETVRFYQFNLRVKDEQLLSFDLFVHNIEQANFIVYDEENGNVLKNWSYAERDEVGKQFYREDSWTLTMDNGSGVSDSYYWVFEITPDDIE